MELFLIGLSVVGKMAGNVFRLCAGGDLVVQLLNLVQKSIDDHVYVQGTGRFRNRKTQKLLIEPGLYNNPTYIALPIA